MPLLAKVICSRQSEGAKAVKVIGASSWRLLSEARDGIAARGQGGGDSDCSGRSLFAALDLQFADKIPARGAVEVGVELRVFGVDDAGSREGDVVIAGGE